MEACISFCCGTWVEWARTPHYQTVPIPKGFPVGITPMHKIQEEFLERLGPKNVSWSMTKMMAWTLQPRETHFCLGGLFVTIT